MMQQGPAGLGVARFTTSGCSLWSIILALGVLKRQSLLQSCLKTLGLRSLLFLMRCKTSSCTFHNCSIEQPCLRTGLYPVSTGNKYLLCVTWKAHASLIVQFSQPNPQIKLLLSPKLIQAPVSDPQIKLSNTYPNLYIFIPCRSFPFVAFLTTALNNMQI